MTMQDERQIEHELIMRARQGEKSAQESLLLKYKSLLYAIAGRIADKSIDQEELIQSGYLGLMRAVYLFDLSKSVAFITYALPWAIGEMRRALKASREQRAAVSLEQHETDEGKTLLDTICGTENIDFSRLDLRLAIQSLTKEEQLLICLRYFRDKTQSETAVLLHKSQAQISRMEQKALIRLQCILK